MYSLADYVRMINDDIRTSQYFKALKSIINPDSVVMDIGAGTGIFTLLSCYLGAKHVYSIEFDDCIQIASELAHDNEFDDKVTFIQDLSTNISIPEKVDIIVSDLKGVMPLFNNHINTIIDARDRHLKKDGILLPQKDTLWATIVHTPELFNEYYSIKNDKKYNINLNSTYKYVRNIPVGKLTKYESIVVSPQIWAILDYYSINQANISGELNWKIEKKSLAHGIRLWFDCNLVDNLSFNTSPNSKKTIYSNVFLPWLDIIKLEKGDIVKISIKCHLVNEEYIYQWNTLIYPENDPDNIKLNFEQSSFYGNLNSLLNLNKRSADFKPEINKDGEIDFQILKMIQDGVMLNDIAQEIYEKFPHIFQSWEKALGHVGALSQKYSK